MAISVARWLFLVVLIHATVAVISPPERPYTITTKNAHPGKGGKQIAVNNEHLSFINKGNDKKATPEIAQLGVNNGELSLSNFDENVDVEFAVNDDDNNSEEIIVGAWIANEAKPNATAALLESAAAPELEERRGRGGGSRSRGRAVRRRRRFRRPFLGGGDYPDYPDY